MDFISLSKKLKIIVLCFLLLGIFLTAKLYIDTIASKKISEKIYTIINEKNESEKAYLRKMIAKDVDHAELQLAQEDAIAFLGNCKDTDSIETIIKYYLKAENFHSRRRCLIALSQIGSMNVIEFFGVVLSKDPSEDDEIFVYERLYEMYFREGVKEKREIYNIYKKANKHNRILSKKYLISYLENDKETFVNLRSIAMGSDLELKERLAEDLRSGKSIFNERKKNDKELADLIGILYSSKNENIVNLLEFFYE